MEDVPDKQPSGFSQVAGAPDGYPECLQNSLSVPDMQPRLPEAPVSELGVGPSGVHAQSPGQHQGDLLPLGLLPKAPGWRQLPTAAAPAGPTVCGPANQARPSHEVVVLRGAYRLEPQAAPQKDPQCTLQGAHSRTMNA